MKTFFLCAMASSAAAVATSSQLDGVLNYERFELAPSAVQKAMRRPEDRYASYLQLDIPYQKSVLTLDLTVNRDLFAPGWSLDTFDDNGNLIGSETDASKFACHYSGSVLGHNSSFVTFSVCDEVGMTGHIHLADDVDLEVLSLNERGGNKSISAASQNLGEHVIYDMRDLVLPEHEMGEIDLDGLDEDVDQFRWEQHDDEVASSSSVYQIDAVVASDSSRMRDYSSSSAEASNAQSIVNAMNTRFANTNWGSGRTIVSRIARQRQNPSGWSSSHNGSIDTYLRNLSSYKENAHPSDDNMIGLTHTRFGSTIGYAWTNRNSSGANPMCHRYSGANVNNVGWSSSNTARGTLVAHEVGHNLRFSHDSSCGNVMCSSISSSSPASRFSSASIDTWNQHRARWVCLAGGSSSCPDSSSFIDENGYRCSDWVGYDCSRDDDLSRAGRLDVKEHCRQACGTQADDSSFRDENGYRCSEWVGYDCARDDPLSTIGRHELNVYCPQACGHC